MQKSRGGGTYLKCTDCMIVCLPFPRSPQSVFGAFYTRWIKDNEAAWTSLFSCSRAFLKIKSSLSLEVSDPHQLLPCLGCNDTLKVREGRRLFLPNIKGEIR